MVNLDQNIMSDETQDESEKSSIFEKKIQDKK